MMFLLSAWLLSGLCLCSVVGPDSLSISSRVACNIWLTNTEINRYATGSVCEVFFQDGVIYGTAVVQHGDFAEVIFVQNDFRIGVTKVFNKWRYMRGSDSFETAYNFAYDWNSVMFPGSMEFGLPNWKSKKNSSPYCAIR